MRKTLFAAAMLAVSTVAMAHGDYVYGRVVTVEPAFSFMVSSGHPHDRFRIMYEVGGQHYWTHSRHHPGAVIWVPRPVVHHVHQHKFKHHSRDGRYDHHHERW